jgi:hypothetical protein
MDVHVVDNDSGDGTAEMVEREFPEVRLTRSGANLGFGRANNIALREGRAAYALVLNPDTRVEPGCLDTLLELMDARPEIGLAGPKLVQADGTLDHAARRSFPTPLGALAHFSGIGRLSDAPAQLSQYRATHLGDDDPGPVDAVNGAFMLLRREALDQVGLFDEGYWMYMEDLDLCMRLHKSGWITWYEPSAVAVHHKAGTSGRRSPKLERAFHYGMYRFYRAHYAPERSPFTNAAVYTGIALKTAWSTARAKLSGA